MVFSTPIFLYGFLPLVLVAYYLLPRRARNGWLVAGSYLFYGWGNPLYVGLLLFSTLLDFWCAIGIAGTESQRRRRRLLACSIVGNLGVLAFFKYTGFLSRVSNELAGVPGADTLAWAGGIMLPLGISFYTFQSLSYTIDVYRGQVQAVGRRGVAGFVCYVALFPQLVAGPIVRFRDIADQLIKRTHSIEKFGTGVFFFMMGFAKKTLIANQVGVLAESLGQTVAPSLLDAWIGVGAFTLQIYFDFSGYSDIARGISRLFGIELMVNFKQPYLSRNITVFWRR